MACTKKGVFFWSLVVAAFIILIGKLTSDNSNRKKPVVEFLGPLTRNRVLNSAVKLFENKIGSGPEGIAIKDGKLYTGTYDGRILEINGDKIRTVTTVGGEACVHDPTSKENRCGRPLGVRFDKDGALVVADSVKGLYKVDTKTGVLNYLYQSSTPVDGQISRFVDDLVITKSGDIYFSDATYKSTFESPIWRMILNGEADGRILHYNPITQKVDVTIDKLFFPNGMELSPDEEFLIFSETGAKEMKKFYIKGTKKGQLETLIPNLPGYPDNIRATPRGTYWVALVIPTVPGQPVLWENIGCDCMKPIVFGSLDLMVYGVDYIRKIMPANFLNVFYDILKICQMRSVTPEYGLVLEINIKGEILRSLHAPNGHVSLISHAQEYENTLYLGSPFQAYLAKLKL